MSTTTSKTMRKSLRALLVAAGTVALVAAGTPAANAADTPPGSTTKSGYTLDFNEDFSTSTLDSSRWLPYYLPHWSSTRENAKARFTIADGVLTERIDADTPAWNAAWDSTVKVSSIQTYEADNWHRFNSNMPNDHHEPTFNGYTTKYGYIEMRAKLSNVGGGGHQALWLVGTADPTLPSKNPEIDMVESFFSGPNAWNIAAHSWGSPDFVNTSSCSCQVSGSPTTEYHVYGMDWTPTALNFYYDGALVKTINDAPNQAMGMILGIYTDAGSGVHNNVWPKSWNVDYLRVFKKNGGYPEYEVIKNRQTGQYLNIEHATGSVESAAVPTTYWSAQWMKESTAAGYVRYRNRWTGEYMHTAGSTGSVQYGAVAANQPTADWKEEPTDGYIRIKNRSNSGYIHTEQATGTAQYGAVPTTWWTSQWSFQPAT